MQEGLGKTTRWSLFEALGRAQHEERTEILGSLISEYWKPVYAYLCRRGCRPHDAEDLTQGFFHEWLGKEGFEGADPNKGRFRSYLLKSLRYYTINKNREARAQKRRPPGGVQVLEEPDNKQASSQSPDQAFHRAWVHGLVMEVLESLREEYDQKLQRTHCQLFEIWHIRPNLYGDWRPSTQELFQEYSQKDETLRNAKDVSNRIGSAKRAFVRLLVEKLGLRTDSKKERDDDEGDVMEALGL